MIEHYKTPTALRKWFEKNHDKRDELWIGFYKKSSGKGGVTYKEAVDLALCYGWIDGIRKSVDAESYTIRFTPRRARSIWSDVNIKRVKELMKTGVIHEAGMAAYERRREDRSGVYSFERKRRGLSDEYVRKIKANKKAWAYYSSRPPGYRRTSGHWVMAAKKEETRERRLGILIECSAKGERVPVLRRSGEV